LGDLCRTSSRVGSQLNCSIVCEGFPGPGLLASATGAEKSWWRWWRSAPNSTAGASVCMVSVVSARQTRCIQAATSRLNSALYIVTSALSRSGHHHAQSRSRPEQPHSVDPHRRARADPPLVRRCVTNWYILASKLGWRLRHCSKRGLLSCRSPAPCKQGAWRVHPRIGVSRLPDGNSSLQSGEAMHSTRAGASSPPAR
jgi:hypothetical protein